MRSELPVLGPALPRRPSRLAAAFGRTLLRGLGWSIEGELPNLSRCVAFIAPHTSNWDFIVGAGAHTRALPMWLHTVLSWVTLVTCLMALHREYRVLGENNRLIEEAGIRAGRLRPDEDTAGATRA